MNNLSAPYSLKKYIIEYANQSDFSGYLFDGPLNTEAEIDAAWEDMHNQIGCDAQQDIMEGDWETKIPLEPSEWSRHCEIKSVAAKDNYGNFLGWPYYFGGGKHFDPYGYYDFSIERAYFLDCVEKEVVAIERTWAKV